MCVYTYIAPAAVAMRRARLASRGRRQAGRGTPSRARVHCPASHRPRARGPVRGWKGLG